VAHVKRKQRRHAKATCNSPNWYSKYVQYINHLILFFDYHDIGTVILLSAIICAIMCFHDCLIFKLMSWITQGIISFIKHRNYLFHVYKVRNSKKFRNYLTHVKESAKRKY